MLLHNRLDKNEVQQKRVQYSVDMGENLWASGRLYLWNMKYSCKMFKGPEKSKLIYEEIKDLLNCGYDVTFIYEAGRYGFTPAREVQKLGGKVHIIPVNKLEIQRSGKKVKTDRIDAYTLAHLDLSRTPNVWIPSVEEENDRMMMRECRRIKVDIQTCNNRILAVLSQWPVSRSKEHLSSEQWLARLATYRKQPKQLPSIQCYRIDNHIREMQTLERNLSLWEKQIAKRAEKQRQKKHRQNEHPVADILEQFKGIGPVISRSFEWGINDFYRFNNGKKFGSFLGLTPTPWVSCNMKREQGISKAGDPELRRLAIELAWLWRMHQKSSKLAKKWEPRLKEKGRARRTAIVAMGRQLMVALYRLIVYGEEIEGAVINKPLKNLNESSIGSEIALAAK